ncbi:MAG: HAD family hydrolase [Acidimicrobiales bacterium]
MTPDAVVFDFDGLIIDSEWLIFETAQAAFAEHGHALGVEAWSTIVGINDEADDRWWARLCEACGVIGFDREDYEAAYLAQPREGRDDLPALPGVVELVDELGTAGVPLAIASSSSRAWLDRHLARLELADRFCALVGADLVGGVGKPAPDVYLRACADLGADPARSVAIEDSAHGVTAAKAAGMAAVAVPSRITIHNDLRAADLVVGSVADLDLARLVALVPSP